MIRKRHFAEKKSLGRIKTLFLVVVIVAAVVLVWWFAETMSVSQEEEQLKVSENAILRASIQCYALEGRYAPSLDYLTENYPVTIDEKKYVYHYQVHGENIMPEIKVFPKEV
jgi:nitric oxide reductase large subunit